MATKKYLVVDISLCHDCNNCFVACKDEFCLNGDRWLPYTDEQPRHGHRWINIERQERGQYPRIDVNFLPKPCQHCADPACKKAYPNAVTVRDDGIVLLDRETAKGQRGLVDSCPYGTIWYNEETDMPQKCILCAHILDGKAGASITMPRCAHSCPTGALTFYDMEEAQFEQKIVDEGLERYLPEISDKGQVYYKNLYRWTKHFIAGGFLKDGDCAEGVTVRIKEVDAPAQVTNYFGDFRFDGLDAGTYTIVADGKEVMKVTIDKSVNVGNIKL